MKNYQEYYNALCKIAFNNEYHFSPFLELLTEKGYFYDCKVVFAVIHRLDHEIIQLSERLADMETAVVLYVVSNENYEEYMQFVSDKLKIIVVPV